MTVNVASFAYFGNFLAQELDRLGSLGQLFTNLPASRTDVQPQRVVSQPLLAAPYYLASRLRVPRVLRWLSWPTIDAFDRWVASRMTPCDVFHCFSGFGRRAHESARSRYGAVTVVERGSSHIAYQDDVLRDEFRRWRVPYPDMDARLKEKELREYDECDYITVQSTFAWRTFVAAGIAEKKLIKLPLGVDLGCFRRIPKRDTTFRVLYAGTLSLRKGIPYLLEAIAPLGLANFEFVVNGTITREVAELIRPHADRITFLPMRRFEELYQVYSQASVLVLPTVEDGFAKVITEAMACGVPVIATTNCGAEDVITDGVEGFIVPIRDAAAIRERLLRLYEDEALRSAMAEAALRRSQAGGGWSTYGERACRAYEQALTAHKAAAAPRIDGTSRS